MASTINHTVADICEIISDLRGESATDTGANRVRAVSRANQDFAGRRFWHFYLLKDQSAGTGNGSTSTFTIGQTDYPMRQKGLSEFFSGGTTEDKRYDVVDFHAYKALYNSNNVARIAYQWYDPTADAWKVTLGAVPRNNDVLTYSYFWEPKELTATTDIVICPDPTAIARLALAEIYEGEDEDDKRNDNLQLAENLIEDMVGTDNEPAINQLQAMGAIENQTRTRGIGTY